MKTTFTFLVLLLLISPVSAQTEDVNNFIDDILLIAGRFSDPAADGVGYQASAGWFSSGSSLEKWDFRVSVHGNGLLLPSKKKSFGISNSELKLLEIEGAENAEIPTAFGGASAEIFTGNINFMGQDIPVSFDAIDGIGRDYVPHAFVQAAVGVSAGTEITVRAMPSVTIDGVTASTYGIGVKHNLSQYFNRYYEDGVQVALAAAYSKLVVEYEFDPQGAEGIVMLDQIDVDANLFMAEFLASKRWNNFELFGAAGIMSSNFDYTFGGTGEYVGEVNNQVDQLEDSLFQFKGDVGFNLFYKQLRFTTIGTVGEFFNLNLGLGFSI